ncbi:MAG: flippase-like domain-containing protein [Candidatus Riflebacteria bacterium]|nr:flippase-like domain-containing protein [Candidatus Riflebacteria bacterium]
MRHAKTLLGLIFSFVFLWLALRNVDVKQLPKLFGQARLIFLPMIAISMTFEHLWRAWRWKILLRARRVPFYNLYAGIVLGYLFNNLLPARAGEFIRSLYLGRKKLARSSEAFGTVVLERFIDGVVIIAILACLPTWFTISPLLRKAIFSAVFFYAVILVCILVLQFQRVLIDVPLTFMLKICSESFRTRVLLIEDSFISGFSLVRTPGPLMIALILSGVAWSFSVLTTCMHFWMWSLPLGSQLGFENVLLLMAVLSIGSMIPSSPGMIGIFQYCCVIVLAEMLGINREMAVVFALATHLVGYLYVLIVGIVIMMVENVSFRELSTSAEAAEKAETAEALDLSEIPASPADNDSQ